MSASARDFRNRLVRRSRKAGVALTPDLLAGLTAYFELLALWNRKINLTALDEPDLAIDRLLVEPLVAARHVPRGARRLIDIGSGGGSPAIPLKLAVPDLSLVMVESKTRKSAFLREAARRLGLVDTKVETARYEELLTRPELHESADLVSLRAVRVEERVLMSLQAFLKPGGLLFLFRSASGPEAPNFVPPTLKWVATHPLVESLRSRLMLVEKRRVGA